MVKKLILFLILILSPEVFCLEQKIPLSQEQPYYASASSFRLREDFAGHAEGLREKVQAATNLVIKFFEKAIEKNVMGIEHLQRLLEAQELINPITQDERNSDSKKLVYASQLDNLILKGNQLFDLARIKDWAIIKIEELQRAEGTRKSVHEDTREIHIPMRFVPIPAGKYVDEITHEEFEIPEGIEIQETPVTQWQWAQVVSKKVPEQCNKLNHPCICPDTGKLGFCDQQIYPWQLYCECNDSKDTYRLRERYLTPSSEDLLWHGIKYDVAQDLEQMVNMGIKISMRANAPVSHVSWDEIQEFIGKLNEADENYFYQLPSIQEYQAISHGIIRTNTFKAASCSSKIPPFDDYRHSRKFLHGVIGDIWQWTRDTVEIYKNKQAHLVFGGSIFTKQMNVLKDIVRPVHSDDSRSYEIGLRILRYQKTTYQNQVVNYLEKQLSWDETDCCIQPCQNWMWDAKYKKLLLRDEKIWWRHQYPDEDDWDRWQVCETQA